MSDPVELSLSVDQAMVLSDWLNRKMHTAEMASLIDDRAVWSPLLKISGSLETKLTLIFDPEYDAALSAARARLVKELASLAQHQRAISESSAVLWSSERVEVTGQLVMFVG